MKIHCVPKSLYFYLFLSNLIAQVDTSKVNIVLQSGNTTLDTIAIQQEFYFKGYDAAVNDVFLNPKAATACGFISGVGCISVAFTLPVAIIDGLIMVNKPVPSKYAYGLNYTEWLAFKNGYNDYIALRNKELRKGIITGVTTTGIVVGSLLLLFSGWSD